MKSVLLGAGLAALGGIAFMHGNFGLLPSVAIALGLPFAIVSYEVERDRRALLRAESADIIA